MSHVLPPLGHPARDLFDVQTLVNIATGVEPVRTHIYELRNLAFRTFDAVPAAKRVAFIRLNPSDDMLELVTFGRRGGWRREWTFGLVGRRARLA